MSEKKNVVVFGGGNGSAMTLRALKRHRRSFDVSAIVSMSDSGGSSGRLMKEFDTLPAGDILRAVLASSPHSYKEFLKPMFHGARFEGTGKLDSHNLGNLFLVLAEQYSGNFMHAVRALEQAVGSLATAYPSTLVKNDLVAEIEGGETLHGEHAIDRPSPEQRKRIQKVWLEPHVEANPEAIEQMKKADYLIFGPGSLYCSIVASILPKGMFEAISESKAELVYIAGDIYEKEGEEGPRLLSEFIHELEQYLPRKIDMILFNGAALSANQLEYYKQRQWGRLTYDAEKLSGYHIIDTPFEKYNGGLDPEKLGNILCDTIGLGADNIVHHE